MGRHRCLYCNYTNATGTPIEKNFLKWFKSPFSQKTSERLKKVYEICCKACKRKYEKLELININWIETCLEIKKVAMQSFKNIYPQNGFEVIFSSVSGITKYNKNTYHVIFQIQNIRSFMDCKKVGDIFIVETIQRLTY